MTEEEYEAYCKRCDYTWNSIAQEKPPRCPRCKSNGDVIYGDEIVREKEPGEPLIDDDTCTVSDDIITTAEDIVNLTGDDVNWDRIRKLEIEHKPRMLIVSFADTGRVFGILIDTEERRALFYDRVALEGYTGNPTGVIEFAYEEVGWQILRGDIPIQVARYEYRDDVVKITTVPGSEEMFWMACSSVFNDIRRANRTVLKELGEW